MCSLILFSRSVKTEKSLYKRHASEGIPEKLNCGRLDVWALGLWTTGRLVSGRLDSEPL